MNLHQSVLVTAANRPMFGVGGSSSHATHVYKSFVVSMEWDEQDGDPVMLIWPALGGRNAGVFGICLSSAGKYANPTGGPTDECVMECAAALPMLGRNLTRPEVHELVDTVMRFMPDLLAMPPAPRAIRLQGKGRALMDITQIDPRGRVVEEVSV